jgi:hypothetical protein
MPADVELVVMLLDSTRNVEPFHSLKAEPFDDVMSKITADCRTEKAQRETIIDPPSFTSKVPLGPCIKLNSRWTPLPERLENTVVTKEKPPP